MKKAVIIINTEFVVILFTIIIVAITLAYIYYTIANA